MEVVAGPEVNKDIDPFLDNGRIAWIPSGTFDGVIYLGEKRINGKVVCPSNEKAALRYLKPVDPEKLAILGKYSGLYTKKNPWMPLEAQFLKEKAHNLGVQVRILLSYYSESLKQASLEDLKHAAFTKVEGEDICVISLQK